MSKSCSTIAIAGGGWSPNIGNGFFNLGTMHVLRQAMPEAKIVFASDQPAYWNFVRHTTPKNSLKTMDYIEADYLVLHGSVLTSRFPTMWSESLSRLRERETKLVFISSGLFDYSEEEIAICRAYLKKYPPYLLVARDQVTYENFHDLAEYSYSGIDSAFFVPDVYQPLKLDLPPYLVLNFDKYTEPRLSIDKNSKPSDLIYEGPELRQSRKFEFAGDVWQAHFPTIRYHLSRRLQKFYPYIAGPLRLHGTGPTHVNGYMIVRTDHQINPMLVSKVFSGPNTFASDIPETYLSLYAQAAGVFSDRIHACVVTLAYGNHAMLFSQSGRARVLERIGAHEISKKPTKISQEYLAEEKKAMLDFIKSVPFS